MDLYSNHTLGQEVVSAFNNGDQPAFETIFKAFFKPMMRFATKFVASDVAVEEIVSTAFLRLWARRGSFADSEKIKGYLFQTVKTGCLMYLREETAYIKRNEVYSQILSDQEGEKEREAIRREVLAILDKLMAEQSPLEQQIYQLSFLQNKSNAEVAAIVQRHPQTIANTKNLLLQKIRDAFSGGYAHPLISVSAIFVFLTYR